jgi:hypothetical protein
MSRAAAEAQRHSAVRFATEHLIGRHNMLIGLLARAKLGLLQQVT